MAKNVREKKADTPRGELTRPPLPSGGLSLNLLKTFFFFLSGSSETFSIKNSTVL